MLWENEKILAVKQNKKRFCDFISLGAFRAINLFSIEWNTQKPYKSNIQKNERIKGFATYEIPFSSTSFLSLWINVVGCHWTLYFAWLCFFLCFFLGFYVVIQFILFSLMSVSSLNWAYIEYILHKWNRSLSHFL